MAAQTSHHRVSSGMSLFHLNNCRQMLVLTHNRVWGTSKWLGLSVTLECFPQTAVTTWPMVWTPGLLAMALPMETYFVALPSLQGHKDASRSIFHYLKHVVFSTFLILCSYLFSFFFHHCKLSPQNCVDLVLIWGICSKTWNYVSASSKGPHHSVPLTYWDMPTTVWLSQPWKLTHLVVVCEFLWITGFQTLVYEQHVYGSVCLIFWEEKNILECIASLQNRSMQCLSHYFFEVS